MRHYVHINAQTNYPTTDESTAEHDYPREEVDTMRKFYGGKNEITGVCELASYAGSVPLAFHPI